MNFIVYIKVFDSYTAHENCTICVSIVHTCNFFIVFTKRVTYDVQP